ncbi:hypothetical protein HUW63_11300 [Myxococcus sp. AM001]|nr:hypothetical protein [Myxococcus sp. AM001]
MARRAPASIEAGRYRLMRSVTEVNTSTRFPSDWTKWLVESTGWMKMPLASCSLLDLALNRANCSVPRQMPVQP